MEYEKFKNSFIFKLYLESQILKKLTNFMFKKN